jgi:hypothetical protein
MTPSAPRGMPDRTLLVARTAPSLTFAIARELRSLNRSGRDRWRTWLNIEIAHAARRNRELLRARKPLDVRSRAEAILADLPLEDPEVVEHRRAVLLGDEEMACTGRCPCGREVYKGGPYCETHQARVRRHGNPFLHIPISSANAGGGGLLRKKDKAA